MPGWHSRTKNLVAEGKIQTFAIAPEQYGERMSLFQQWQGLDFPVLMDPLNLLEVKAVPITLLVDEGGTIRYRNPKPKDVSTFLSSEYQNLKNKQKQPPLHPLSDAFFQALNAKDTRPALQALLLHASLSETEELSPELAFQAGVVARWLYDQEADPKQFQTAVNFWQKALSEIPGQYIWRRRIQQYGPRLDKPYPFYNWIETARKELTARGKTPIILTVEPSGSEVAGPARNKKEAPTSRPFPEAKNKLPNEDELLAISATFIPHTDRKDSQRIHFHLAPQKGAEWSSDAQEIELWLLSENEDPLLIPSDASTLAPEIESSAEPRTLEAEIAPSQLEKAELVIYYSLCEKENSVCRFLKTEWKKGLRE